MSKLTPWFPATVKPVRPGRYEIRNAHPAPHRNSRFRLTGRFRTFDGRFWQAGWTGEEISIFGNHTSQQWRGLAEPPRV